jgi:hypothetical protein
VKLELNLTSNEHALLLEANSHDRTHRSLESFAKALLLDGLDRAVSKDLGQRKAAVATLVGTGSKRRAS